MLVVFKVGSVDLLELTEIIPLIFKNKIVRLMEITTSQVIMCIIVFIIPLNNVMPDVFTWEIFQKQIALWL